MKKSRKFTDCLSKKLTKKFLKSTVILNENSRQEDVVLGKKISQKLFELGHDVEH